MNYHLKTAFSHSLFSPGRLSLVALLCFVVLSALSPLARSADSRPFQVGDAFEGGIVAYILQPGDPGFTAAEIHGFVASTADQSDGTVWSNVTDAYASTGTAIGTGVANTITIRKQHGHTASAAQTSVDYSVTNGCSTYDDWYLPSRDELNKLYLNRSAIRGFADAFYWSSSEYDGKQAWSQNFGDGKRNFGNLKNFKAHIRSIRFF